MGTRCRRSYPWGVGGGQCRFDVVLTFSGSDSDSDSRGAPPPTMEVDGQQHFAEPPLVQTNVHNDAIKERWALQHGHWVIRVLTADAWFGTHHWETYLWTSVDAVRQPTRGDGRRRGARRARST